MKLWELYIQEREDAKVIYNDNSFVTYRILENNEILVMDLFVQKEHRNSGLVNKLWNDLLKKTMPSVVYGMTDVKALNWENSHNFMISFGFIPYTQENDIIYYFQEIN